MSDRVRVGSLFSGVGGFDLGLEYAGMETAWQVENDKWCQQVLRARWPDVNLYGDVQDVGADELAGVDLICGGFPCQDLSVAGRRAGLAGSRSGLFFEFVRIAREVAPRWILIENVSGLLSSNDGEDFRTVLRKLTGFWPVVPDSGWQEAGVCEGPRGRAVWRVLDTQYFGPPQRRRRVFIVVDTAARCGPEVLFEPSCVPGHPAAGGTTWKVASTLPASGAGTSRSGGPGLGSEEKYVAGWRGGVAETLRVGGREQGAGNSYDNTPWFFNATQDPIHDERAGALSDQGAAVYPTLRENYRNNSNPATEAREGVAPPIEAVDGRKWGSHQWVDQGKCIRDPIPRRLTPTECERLQGFPDGWTATGVDAGGEPTEISDTQRYKQMGNAVSVPVAAWIGARIVAAEMRAIEEAC